MNRRLGLFGGTFDPPHLGHLALAEWARDRLRLDRVIFMPAGQPPHKRRRDLLGIEHRLAMARLAVRGAAGFEVSTLEAGREGPSFTLDTLRELRLRNPGDRWFLLMGEDSLADLPHWHEPAEVVRLATPVVAARPGRSVPRVSRIFGRPLRWLDNPGIEVSSSVVRARARAGRTVRYLVPDAVARYIARHRLYARRVSGT
jgi:nicotinate-nucleotide adenylyltransferase